MVWRLTLLPPNSGRTLPVWVISRSSSFLQSSSGCISVLGKDTLYLCDGNINEKKSTVRFWRNKSSWFPGMSMNSFIKTIQGSIPHILDHQRNCYERVPVMRMWRDYATSALRHGFTTAHCIQIILLSNTTSGHKGAAYHRKAHVASPAGIKWYNRTC